MELSLRSRIKGINDFYEKVQNNFNLKLVKDDNYVYKNINDMFNMKELNSGVEGIVYLSNLIDDPKLNKSIVIKKSHINKLQKDIPKGILSKNPKYLYDLFEKIGVNLTRHSKNDVLIESIMYKLINQLVFQNICPLYNVNYYWEFIKPNDSNLYLYFYNELVTNNNKGEYSKITSSNENDPFRDEYEKLLDTKKDIKEYSTITLLNWLKYKGVILNNLSVSNKYADVQKYIYNHTCEIYNVIAQVLIGIIGMYKYFNIIHGDLHCENILIQSVNPGGNWRYIIEGTEILIPNLGFMVIINDFGLSSIKGLVEQKWYSDSYLNYFSNNNMQNIANGTSHEIWQGQKRMTSFCPKNPNKCR